MSRIADVLAHLDSALHPSDLDLPPMLMKKPPHPGYSIKDACLDSLNRSVTDGAKVLGVARHTLSRVINGQTGISLEMAIRLEKAGWSNADHWLLLQTAYDLAQARYEPRLGA